MSRKLRAAIFWGLLALGVGGTSYDPRQTEDIVRIMNETKIEVVLENGEGPPEGYELEPIAVRAGGDDARVPANYAARKINWRMRLKRFLKLS